MKKKIIILMSVLLVFVIGIWAMYYYNIGIPCVYYELVGLYCPGCGITRAFYSLIKLDFYQAFRYNALSFIIFPLIFLYVVAGIYSWLFNKPNFMDKRIPPKAWIVIIIVMLAYGLLRNIPGFSYLAPTTI